MELIKKGYIGGQYTEVFKFEGVEFRFPFGCKPSDGSPLKWEGETLIWSDGQKISVSFETEIYRKNPVENWETGTFNRI